MSSPYTTAKAYSLGLFLLGLVGMGSGFKLSTTQWTVAGVILAIAGFRMAIINFNRLLQLAAAERVLKADGHEPLRGEHRGKSIPQQIFMVLFTVAETDGRAGERERQLVRQFMLDRLPDPRVLSELSAWGATPLPRNQLGSMLHALRAQLSNSECETLFYWCCLITLVDETFSDREHDTLQFVSRNLGLEPGYARTLFLHAKSKILRQRQFRGGGASGGAGGGGFRSGPNGGGWAGGRTYESSRGPRARALETLGLESDATDSDIKRRHRELVKKHHPDRHGHLGPVAQKEATERFREIQEAYEVLVGKS